MFSSPAGAPNPDSSSITSQKPLHPVPLTPPKLLTLDATGTLMRLRTSVGMYYRDALFVSTDFKARLPGPDVFTQAFFEAYAQESKKSPCFGKNDKGSRDWWREVVKGTYDRVPQIDNEKFLREELDGPLFDIVFDKLYDEIFSTTEAWELKPYTAEFLRNLKSWRDSGSVDAPTHIGVVSNFDDRLHKVLEELEIYDVFDFVLTSGEVGSEKPERGIFEEARKRAGIAVGEQWDCVHVGDNFEKDVRGAKGAGFEGIYLPSDGGVAVGMEDSGDAVKDYLEVPDLESLLFLYGRSMEDSTGTRIIKTTRNILELGNNSEEERAYLAEEIDKL